jgi:hypothetical protein
VKKHRQLKVLKRLYNSQTNKRDSALMQAVTQSELHLDGKRICGVSPYLRLAGFTLGLRSWFLL